MHLKFVSPVHLVSSSACWDETLQKYTDRVSFQWPIPSRNYFRKFAENRELAPHEIISKLSGNEELLHTGGQIHHQGIDELNRGMRFSQQVPDYTTSAASVEAAKKYKWQSIFVRNHGVHRPVWHGDLFHALAAVKWLFIVAWRCRKENRRLGVILVSCFCTSKASFLVLLLWFFAGVDVTSCHPILPFCHFCLYYLIAILFHPCILVYVMLCLCGTPSPSPLSLCPVSTGPPI